MSMIATFYLLVVFFFPFFPLSFTNLIIAFSLHTYYRHNYNFTLYCSLVYINDTNTQTIFANYYLLLDYNRIDMMLS